MITPFMHAIKQDQYNKIKTLNPIPTVDLLVTHKDRLLLMLRNNKPAKDQWFTPGGRILKDEPLEETVKRVLKEETGLHPTTITQISTISHIWPQAHTVTTIYKVQVGTDEVKMNEEHRDYKWVKEPPGRLHPYVKEMITYAKVLDQ